MQWLGYGTSFSNLLNQLESLGFFAYILPFLLIFAVVYAILTKIDTFRDNKGAGVLIAVAIGLLALQLNYVPAFFQNIFPKFGIGVAILLIALILAGAFISGQQSYKWIFFGLGTLIFLIVTIASLSDWQFIGSMWWQEYGALVIVIVVIIGAVVGVILTGKVNPQGSTVVNR